MTRGEETRKYFNTALIHQEQSSTFELFNDIHDAIPLILHCKKIVLIPKNFFEHMYHIGCAVSVHSITNSGLIAGRQNSSRHRQTVFFTAVNPMNKDHRDQQELDLTKPRLASYKKKWKVHQDIVYWVDIQLAQRKGLKFCSNKIERNHPLRYTPTYCISRAIVMESEDIIYQKCMCHLDHHRRFPTKIIGCAI